jgi:hypothetical protein
MARYGGSWESDQDENRVAWDGHAYAELGHQEFRFESVFRDVSGNVGDVSFEDIGNVRHEEVRHHDRHPAQAGGAYPYGQRERGGCSGSGAEPAREGHAHAHPDAWHVLCR